MRYFRLMRYYIYRNALTARQVRRFQKDPQKWRKIWVNQDIESFKELQNEYGDC